MRLGVTSRVAISDEGFPGITAKANGAPAELATTRHAIELLLGTDTGACVTVDQTMELPVSQGFGMSAAGALSAALAVAAIQRRPRHDAIWAAHSAEVVNRSGLGDVVGANLGGFETRREPGIAPHGRVEAFPTGDPVEDVLLAVVDEAILTKKVLADPEQRRRIKETGREALRRFWDAPSLRSFADTSREFSLSTRLASDRIARVYRETERLAYVSQCMLGGSVFAFGRSAEVRQRLAKYGPVFATRIDREGARLLP